MKHIRSIRTQKCSITVILQHNGMIVTGTSEGRINFYDLQLKILYWCDKCGLDSIRSISFDLRSTLLGPVSTISTSDFDFDEEEDLEYEGEFEESSENKRKSTICDLRGEDVKQIEKKILQPQDNVPSTVTINLEYPLRDWDEKREQFVKPSHVPVDATLEKAPFYVDNFFIITGNVNGLLCLHNYEKRKLIVHKRTPPLPDLRLVLDDQIKDGNIIYVTCAQSPDRQSAISVLKYSPIGKHLIIPGYIRLFSDELACGLDNGTLWLLHPITLEPLDEIPYKHSTESIVKLTFTECAEYMAYSDNTLVVAVFKRNHDSGSHLWNFIGKYRTHYAPIRDILFGPPTPTSIAPRLFSLGEDKNLIEYDLKDSGPYPEPGLKIIEIHQIEYSAIPLSLSWYPELGIERFLMISNSEVLPGTEFQNKGYVIFATDKEIGLQILPFDGNPYKMLGMIGHPSKITNVCVNCDGNILFTSGYNEPCVLMWKIKHRSVDVLASLGGQSLSPYYCLIEGGRKGWLISEMKDLFYYAQILHQGENTTATRIVSEKVATKQIPNLMRAVGYYPSNEEVTICILNNFFL
ncbi:cilia- and flagella-associated protein 251-like [Hylaeus anthracinus]|uniref:cilia- and flagella-associated protein 251-like n=1 Tax=Hylaeus anthracinus TaxID=313031 RepID=UPI0023BA32BD|nr:cilia- and flagella-associated protein 251-like [Hylaeus anthracinus]